MGEILKKPVTITASAVEPKTEKLSKGNSEQLIWKSQIAETTLTITFTENVFQFGKVFQVPSNGATPSGPIDPETETGKEYSYTVTRDDNDEEIDPRVFIDK